MQPSKFKKTYPVRRVPVYARSAIKLTSHASQKNANTEWMVEKGGADEPRFRKNRLKSFLKKEGTSGESREKFDVSTLRWKSDAFKRHVLFF